MKKPTKILVLSLAIVMCLGLFVGCKDNSDAGYNVQPIGELEYGKFYKLQEVYDGIALNQDDIMHVAYFLSGSVYKVEQGEEAVNIAFKPRKKELVLNTALEEEIRNLYVASLTDENIDKEEIAEHVQIRGLIERKGLYIVVIWRDDVDMGDIPLRERVGKITWEQTCPYATAIYLGK